MHERDTGMPDEKEYQSHLLTLEEACARLKACWMDDFAAMLCMAYALWRRTVDHLERERAGEAAATSQQELQAAAHPQESVEWN